MWRDEAKGLVNGKARQDPEAHLGSEAEETDASRRRAGNGHVVDDGEDEDSAAVVSEPPSSRGIAITDDDDDWDFEGMLRKQSDGQTMKSDNMDWTLENKPYYATAREPDEEEDFWADEREQNVLPTRPTPPKQAEDVEDDDVWAMIADPDPIVKAGLCPPSVDDDDESMYV